MLLNRLFDYPVTETPTHWITHGFANQDLNAAQTSACEAASLILVTQWGWSDEDAFVFLGVEGELAPCRAVHPSEGTVIAKMKVPRMRACPGVVNR